MATTDDLTFVEEPADPEQLWSEMLSVSRRGDEAQFRGLRNRLALHPKVGKPFLAVALGQSFERTEELEAAAERYAAAVAIMREQGPDAHGELDPAPSEWVEYFARNNLGFCLNGLGRHEEAEPYLWEAIKLDPKRGNAYKNLGISLRKRHMHVEAALIWLEGSTRCPSDGRSLGLLEELLEQHPWIHARLPQIDLEQLQRQNKDAAFDDAYGRIAAQIAQDSK